MTTQPNWNDLRAAIDKATDDTLFADSIGHDGYTITTNRDDESLNIHIDGYRFRTGIVPDAGMGTSYYWGHDLNEDMTDDIDDVRDSLLRWAARMIAWNA